MVKSVDTGDLKSPARKGVPVRVRLGAPRIQIFSRSGGIGRRGGFKIRCLTAWGFESPLRHQTERPSTCLGLFTSKVAWKSHMNRLFSLLAELTRPSEPVNLDRRVEPTVPRLIVSSPFEVASEELARDGWRRFSSVEDLRARVKGTLSPNS